MSMKGYGTITITDVLDGAQIWTSTTAPTSPNYTFKIANLVGDPDAEIKIGDLIFYSYYRYTVQSISDTTVLTGSRTSIRGETGAQGTSVVSIYNQYYLSTSSTTQLDGNWVENIPDYIDGRYYWSRPVTKLSNNNVVYGTPVLETSITELMAKVTPGVGMKINYSAFNTPNSGKMYIHGYSNESPADIDGCIYWNNVKRTVPKKMINPNAILPYNKYIYIVLRLSSAAATTGTLYMVWYNSGWKYAITPTPSAVGGTWNWTETTDIVLGQFIQPGAGQDVVQAYLYNPPRTASQVKTTNASPYQYSQSAVDWYNSNGGNVVNATTMLAAWADGAFSATTEINGGFIKAHTIQSEHLATNAIMSSNFQGSDNPSSPFSATGTFLDLATGNIYSPNFGIDNTYGKAYLNGEIIATSGRIGNSSATNYWEIGTKVDYNAQQSAALIGKGTAYIQVGDFQLSNGLLDTRSYDQSNQLTYPKYDDTYWDFGVQAPVLDTSTTGFVSGVDDNFIYIRKHVNTIPTLKTDWDYVFRIDKTGMIYMNDVSLDDRYALKTDVGSTYLPVSGGTITGNLTVNGTLNAIASQASKLTKTITINGTSWDGSSSTTIGTMGVQYGGTGATTFTSGYALIGNGQNAIQTRAIRNNTTAGALGWTSSSADNTLITTNTLAYWDGRYQASGNKSNLEYVKQGKLGTVVTLDAEDVITTSGGIIDGSLQVTDLTAGNLIVTGAARFTNGLLGDLTGNADTADKVNNNLIIKLNSGTTEGTNMFTFNGSVAKTIDVTKSAIGLGNVENTKLSTWTGSSSLTTAKVGTFAAAATKSVDSSIAASSTSGNLPTSAAVASFVEGKGYVTSSGVTSVRVQATSPVVSSTNTAQSSTLNTTISLADGYGDTKNPYASKTKGYILAAPSGENGVPTFRALIAADIPTLSLSKLSGVDDLTAIEGLTGTSGLLKKTAANAWTLDTNTYVTSSGVTSITLKAGTGISLDTDNTAITSTGTRIISNAGVRSISESTVNGKISVNTGGTSADIAIHGLGSWAYKSSGSASDVGLGNVTNNKQVKGLLSGTTSGHFVLWGSDGYTVSDAGVSKSDLITGVQISGSKLTVTKADGASSSSTVTITASQASGATILTDAQNTALAVGDSSHPVYFAGGIPVQGNVIPGITLNGSATTSPNFYAPTGAGTSGQYLKSNGSGAPTWATFSKSTVGLGNVANLDQSKAIKSITKSGATYTATALDNTTFTFVEDITGVKGSEESSYRTGNVSISAANVGAVAKTAELLTTNPFAPPSLKGPYISKIDNAFYAADKRWNVTATNSSSSVSTLFDGSYDSTFYIGGNTSVITIDFSPENNGYFPGYPYGYILVSFYYAAVPTSVSGRVYCNFSSHGIGWHDITFTPIADSGTYSTTYRSAHQGYYQISTLEITVVGDTTNSYGGTMITQIEMHLDRPDSRRNPFVSKYNEETLYYDLTAPNFIGNLIGNANTATKANITSTANAVVKYSDTSGTFSDSNVRIENNDLIIGSMDGSTVVGAGNFKIGVKNDNYGIMPHTNNYNQIGSSSLYWYRAYVTNYYGTTSAINNWVSGKNIGTPSSSSAASTLGTVNFYNNCAAGGTQTKTTLTADSTTTSNIILTLPNTTGTIALTSSDITGNAATATSAINSLNLLAYSSNEVTIGANNATAGSSTNNSVWLNYRDCSSGATTNDSTKLVHYYFGNRKGSTDDVIIHAETFKGYVSGNVSGTASNVTGTVAVDHGGTGKTSWTQYGLLYATKTNELGQLGVGTSGQVLVSGGSAAPAWTNQSALSVGSATKATQDASGNTITTHYCTLSTAQTISGAKTFSAATSFTNTTASTSKTTGGVKVSGGLGVAGAIHGQTLSVDDAVTMQYNSTTASLDFIFN